MHASPPLVQVARQNLEPLQERLTLVEGSVEVARGIETLPAPGHTPGHMVLSIASAGRHLLHLSDLALHPLHLEHPQWHSAFDISPAPP